MRVSGYNFTKLGDAEWQALQVRAHWGEKPYYTLADGRVGFKVPADSQRKRVYQWDRRMRNHFPAELGRCVPLAAAQTLVARVLTDYGIDPDRVEVRMGRSDKRRASAGHRVIRFGPGSLLIELILHEVCHTVLKNYDLCDSHGPRFAALLREVIHDYAGVSRGFNLASLATLTTGERVRYHWRDLGDGSMVKLAHITKPRTYRVRFAALNQIPQPLWRAASSRMAAGRID